MNYEHYKAASEATDADERALIPGFKRTKPVAQVNGPKQSIGQLRNRARMAGPELRAKLQAQIARMESEGQ